MATEKLLIDLQTVNMDEVDTSDCTDVEDILSAVITYLSEQPIVDAVEVVRCKDCRWAREKDHREPTDTPRDLICQCFLHHYIPAPWGARMAVKSDDFCSYGERSGNGC